MKTWLKTTQTRPRVLWFLPTHFSCKDHNFSWLSGLSWEEILLHTLLHSDIWNADGEQGSLVQVDTKWKHKSFTLNFWGEIPNLSGRSVSRIFRSLSPGWDQHLGPLHRSSKLKKCPVRPAEALQPDWPHPLDQSTSLNCKGTLVGKGWPSSLQIQVAKNSFATCVKCVLL